jgi:hypothetical protein
VLQAIINDHRQSNPAVLDQDWLRPIGIGTPL